MLALMIACTAGSAPDGFSGDAGERRRSLDAAAGSTDGTDGQAPDVTSRRVDGGDAEVKTDAGTEPVPDAGDGNGSGDEDGNGDELQDAGSGDDPDAMGELDDQDRALARLINDYRTENGLSPIALSLRLQRGRRVIAAETGMERTSDRRV